MSKTLDLSFWRMVIILQLATDSLWWKKKKDVKEVYFLHIGSFTDGDSTAIKIIILYLCFSIGYKKN
jgi:hypothetical protein